MNPVVGIGVSIDRGKRWRPGHEYLYVHRGYSQAIKAAGGIPLLVPIDAPRSCVDQLAGLIISGGDDLPPRFGMKSTPIGEPEDQERIDHDRALLDAFANARKPVLGICYGMQLMNLHYGGGLFRSVAEEYHGALDHGGSSRVAQHLTRRVGDSRLLTSLPDEFTTNSVHGQGVRDVAPGFEVTACASDGLVEAIERGPMFGVEWHPESDNTREAIYSRFVQLCREPRV